MRRSTGEKFEIYEAPHGPYGLGNRRTPHVVDYQYRMREKGIVRRNTDSFTLASVECSCARDDDGVHAAWVAGFSSKPPT
jgi:hypothetical protein